MNHRLGKHSSFHYSAWVLSRKSEDLGHAVHLLCDLLRVNRPLQPLAGVMRVGLSFGVGQVWMLIPAWTIISVVSETVC